MNVSSLNVLNSESANLLGVPYTEDDTSLALDERIKKMITSADIFLFMKGNVASPKCGFSGNVVGLLNHLNATYKTFDILSDFELREGIKKYSDWPTYPQLYYKGELIGGNDILMELYQQGDLPSTLGLE